VNQGRQIKTLQTEQTELKNGLNDMSKELEVKVKEILQVRSEANQTLKYDPVCFVIFLQLAYLTIISTGSIRATQVPVLYLAIERGVVAPTG